MPAISLHGQTYTYILTKQPRKSIRMRMPQADLIEINAPKAFTSKKAELLLQQNAEWIEEQRKNHRKKETVIINQNITDGATLLWKGSEITLNINTSDHISSVSLMEHVLTLHCCGYKTPEIQLKEWYIEQSMVYLKERTAFWQELIGVEIRSIRVKDQKTRWGSCSALGNINYNWRMIMAPAKVIDYLIIHELCHRLHLNHSPAYWKMVAYHCPDYKKQQNWLKANGYLLFRIF